MHYGKNLVLAHPATVDPIFPLPDPLSLYRPAAARGYGKTISRANQAEEVFLRRVGNEGNRSLCVWSVLGFIPFAKNRRPEIARQRKPLSDGEHAGFRPRMQAHGSDVAGGKNKRMGSGLETIVDGDKTMRVDVESGGFWPVWSGRLGCPEQIIVFVLFVLARVNVVGRNLSDSATSINGDFSRGEDASITLPDLWRVSGQNRRGSSEKGKGKSFFRRLLFREQFFEAVLEAERQLHPAGAGAHNDESSQSIRFSLQFALDCRPPLQKKIDGFDWDGVGGRAGYPTDGRRGSGVNRKYVKSDGRPLPAVYFAVLKVQSNGGVLIELRVRKLAERKHADVALGKSVVAGDMPRKHPGVRRVVARRH